MEVALLLSDDYLLNALRIIWADHGVDLPPQYARMVNNVSRRLATRPPAYEAIIRLINTLMSGLHPHFEPNYIVESPEIRLNLWGRGRETLPWTSAEVTLIHQEWNRALPGSMFVDKLIMIDQEREATNNILEVLIGSNKTMDTKVFNTLRGNITGQVAQHAVSPFLRAAAVYCQTSQNTDLVFKLVQHVSLHCRNIQNSEGPAFFEFMKEMLQPLAAGGSESTTSFYLHALTNVPKWAPGLLAYYDVGLRVEVEDFLRERIFSFGTSPEFPDNEGGTLHAETIVLAARQLGISCLTYLRDNYVQRRIQVAKDSVAALQRVIAHSSKYFVPEGEEGQTQSDADFAELCRGECRPLVHGGSV
jgi:ubiquitin carboxyl-terminal hydrolase 34